MEVRETYYEVYFDGTLHHEGTLEICKAYAINSRADDCAEVYKVTVTEEKVIV